MENNNLTAATIEEEVKDMIFERLRIDYVTKVQLRNVKR